MLQCNLARENRQQSLAMCLRKNLAAAYLSRAGRRCADGQGFSSTFFSDEILDFEAGTTVMGWTAPRPASMCQDGRCHNPSEESRPWASLSRICRLTIVGLDIAKSVFQVHGVDAGEAFGAGSY